MKKPYEPSNNSISILNSFLFSEKEDVLIANRKDILAETAKSNARLLKPRLKLTPLAKQQRNLLTKYRPQKNNPLKIQMLS